MRMRPDGALVIVSVVAVSLMLMRSDYHVGLSSPLRLRFIDRKKQIGNRQFFRQQPLFLGVANQSVERLFVALDAEFPRVGAEDGLLLFPNLPVPGEVRIRRVGIVAQG